MLSETHKRNGEHSFLTQGLWVSWVGLASKLWVTHSCLSCLLLLCPAEGLPAIWYSHGQGQLLKRWKRKHSDAQSWLLPLPLVFFWLMRVTWLKSGSTE